MRLFHFSDTPDIAAFVPRPPRTPARRAAGMEWLNGPLVWAIDERHQPLYLFPRDCPRIVVWRTGRSVDSDWARWCGDSDARMVAFTERDAVSAIEAATIFRYEFPGDRFEPLSDAGMWVSRETIRPVAVEAFADLPDRLASEGAELRVVDDLGALRGIWDSTLHASGIRLRNAKTWPAIPTRQA